MAHSSRVVVPGIAITSRTADGRRREKNGREGGKKGKRDNSFSSAKYTIPALIPRRSILYFFAWSLTTREGRRTDRARQGKAAKEIELNKLSSISFSRTNVGGREGGHYGHCLSEFVRSVPSHLNWAFSLSLSFPLSAFYFPNLFPIDREEEEQDLETATTFLLLKRLFDGKSLISFRQARRPGDSSSVTNHSRRLVRYLAQ